MSVPSACLPAVEVILTGIREATVLSDLEAPRKYLSLVTHITSEEKERIRAALAAKFALWDSERGVIDRFFKETLEKKPIAPPQSKAA